MQYYKHKQKCNMKHKKILIVIILFGFISTIFPQSKFRRAAYLTQSVGTHIYQHAGATTSVPIELAAYNTSNGYTGDDACTIYNPTNDYPPGGNMLWLWRNAFEDSPGYSFKEDYLDTDTYDIIMIKHCFESQSGIWFWWYEGPQDTLGYPETQSNYNYQWYIRKILTVMERYPNKFFFWWNLPSATEEEGTLEDMVRLKASNKWMTDTLQAGLDSYGAFPPNVKIFDYFSLLVDTVTNYEQIKYRDAINDAHPNALASSVVAPILVQRMFDAAIAYEESLLPVELTSFSATIIGSTVKLSWNTATEINNFGFDVERTSTSPTQGWKKIGFLEGNGNSNSPKYYSFEDNNLTARKYSYRLKQIDSDGQFEYSKVIEVDLDTPMKYELSQNYPNPFNPTTSIRFSLPVSGNVKLTLYDSNGQEVRSILNEYRESGTHIINFNASRLSSGAYIYKLTAGTSTNIGKMIVIK